MRGNEGAVTASYYEILEVDEHASHEVIKRRFLDLSLRFQRELETAASPQVVERVQFRRREVDEAWAVLRSPADRARYDDELRAQRIAQPADGAGGLLLGSRRTAAEVDEPPVLEIVPLVPLTEGAEPAPDAVGDRGRSRGRRWRRTGQ